MNKLGLTDTLFRFCHLSKKEDQESRNQSTTAILLAFFTSLRHQLLPLVLSNSCLPRNPGARTAPPVSKDNRCWVTRSNSFLHLILNKLRGVVGPHVGIASSLSLGDSLAKTLRACSDSEFSFQPPFPPKVPRLRQESGLTSLGHFKLFAL